MGGGGIYQKSKGALKSDDSFRFWRLQTPKVQTVLGFEHLRPRSDSALEVVRKEINGRSGFFDVHRLWPCDRQRDHVPRLLHAYSPLQPYRASHLRFISACPHSRRVIIWVNRPPALTMARRFHRLAA